MTPALPFTAMFVTLARLIACDDPDVLATAVDTVMHDLHGRAG